MALHVIDLKATYNVQNNGADYTQQLHDAEVESFAAINAGDAVKILFPDYSVKHSDTWVLRGSQSASPWVSGNYGDGIAAWGSSLDWCGALPTDPSIPDKTQVYYQEGNKGRWWGVAINGNDIAGRSLWVGASEWNNWGNEKATSGFSVRNAKLCRVRPARDGNGCLAFGTDPTTTGGATFQCDSWVVRDVVMMPESNGATGFSYPGMKAFGFKTLSPGNCKIGELTNININVCNKAIDWGQSSGYLSVRGIQMGDVRQAFEANSGALDVSGFAIECGNVDDFRLLTGTTQAGSCASFRSGYADWATAFKAGSTTDHMLPILLHYYGNLVLEQNLFKANGGQPFIMSKPCLARNGGGSFRSRQNWYVGCGTDSQPYIPIYDGQDPVWNNFLAPLPGSYAATTWLDLKSEGDMGGLYNGLRLTDIDNTTH